VLQLNALGWTPIACSIDISGKLCQCPDCLKISMLSSYKYWDEPLIGWSIDISTKLYQSPKHAHTMQLIALG